MPLFTDLKNPEIRPQKISLESLKEVSLKGDLRVQLEAFLRNDQWDDVRILEYTTLIHIKKTDQKSIIPNQYFFIAAYVYDYVVKLAKYCDFYEKNIYKKIDLSTKDKYNAIRSKFSELDDSDVTNIISFLFPDTKGKGRNAVTAKTERTAEELFSSDILNVLGFSNASADILGKLIYILQKRRDLYERLRNICCGVSQRKKVFSEEECAPFLLKVLKYTLERDPNLSKLSFNTTSSYLRVNKFCVGRDTLKLPTRESDYDSSIQWEYEEKKYYANKEITPSSFREAFVPEYNKSYNELFEIKEENNEFVLYEFDSPSSYSKAPSNCLQKIYYGAPGTGKSFKIDDSKNGLGLKDIPSNRKFRATFHPDYDYAQFVGTYKPKPVNPDAKKVEITYSFVPQIFAKAYVAAWKNYLSGNKNNVFIVIEEINRGNCAQIFGDIFQLLDRKEGHSEYPVDIDADFATYIEGELRNNADVEKAWEIYKKTIQEWCASEKSEGLVGDFFCKIALPPNFNILATMNTSDQSLFPMDSAFKRRFDWEYVPIRYEAEKDKDGKKKDENWKADEFWVDVDEKYTFNWLHFLKKVNADIYKVTESEDKQMGEFFIKSKHVDQKITYQEFRSKVLFYLWDSVYKDEVDRKVLFHFDYNGTDVTFQRLFSDDFPAILKKMLQNLDEAYNSDEFKNFKILNPE